MTESVTLKSCHVKITHALQIVQSALPMQHVKRANMIVDHIVVNVIRFLWKWKVVPSTSELLAQAEQKTTYHEAGLNSN